MSDENAKHFEQLKAIGAQADKDVNLAEAALHLAVLNHPGISLDRYKNHLKQLGEDVKNQYETLIKAKADPDTPRTRLAALKDVLALQNNYTGDEDSYDDLENANLIRVIDRRKGMPISLSILYIHAARAQGWDIAGLDMPGHFIVRLDLNSERLIFDPFYDCRVLNAADLRALVKKTLGDRAELSVSYYEPTPNRSILIRLQNNIKVRQLEHEDFEGALRTVESMRAIAPDEYRLLFETGILYARTGQPRAAIEDLEQYIDKAPNNKDREDAALLLQQIRQNLN